MCLSRPVSPTNFAGAVVGGFRVEEKLGEDAFGELHRAVAIEGGGDAIVRIVRAEGGAARRDRLIRETRRAAQLKHESLATVLEVGQTPEGDMFVAVERIEGERLSDRLSGGQPLPEQEAARIAAQIARALAAAHDADVVHRNLRPSLVALSGEGEDTRVKVEGLATPRASSASSAEDPELAYAAPEQRRGEPVGRRADVYSIGAMLQAMLTGKPPATNASTDADALEGANALEGPLGDVVKRCLAEDPRERFLDTIALGAALRMAMEKAPRAPSRPPPSKRSQPPSASASASGSTPPPPSAAASPKAAATSSPPSSGAPVSPRGPASAPLSERPPSSRGQASRPISMRPPSSPEASPSAGRAPAAPPPRPLGRPLTARPKWEETLLDLSDGPLPRVAATVLVTFVIARILTSGLVPFVVAILAGVAAYASKVWRKPRGDR